MNLIVKRIATGVALSMVVMLGTVAVVPDAAAHGVTKSRYVDYQRYGYRRSMPVFPRWLRAKRDFQQWYLYSNYRFMRRMSWERLYDLYLMDSHRSRRAWWRSHRYDRDWRGNSGRRDRGHRHRG